MRYYVTIRDKTVQVDLEPDSIQVDGKVVSADLVRVKGTDIHSLLMHDASHRLVARREGQGSWRLFLRGQMLEAEVVDERTRAIREMTGTTGDQSCAQFDLETPVSSLAARTSRGRGRSNPTRTTKGITTFFQSAMTLGSSEASHLSCTSTTSGSWPLRCLHWSQARTSYLESTAMERLWKRRLV